MKFANLHLVPPPVQDIATKLFAGNLGENEEMALVLRLEEIKSFCEKVLEKSKSRFAKK